MCDEVTVFDPENEATELRLSDPNVLFPRQDGTLATGRIAKHHAGELVLNGKCLGIIISGSNVFSPVLPLRPGTFELNVEDGAVKVIDATGRVVAQQPCGCVKLVIILLGCLT